LPYRSEWDKAFLAYADKLSQVKSVVLCGDLNVAHQAIDLARPEANYNKTFCSYPKGGTFTTKLDLKN
jgi:exodeoxyribonuclease-3